MSRLRRRRPSCCIHKEDELSRLGIASVDNNGARYDGATKAETAANDKSMLRRERIRMVIRKIVRNRDCSKGSGNREGGCSLSYFNARYLYVTAMLMLATFELRTTSLPCFQAEQQKSELQRTLSAKVRCRCETSSVNYQDYTYCTYALRSVCRQRKAKRTLATIQGWIDCGYKVVI
jgi:hypothetical protein